MNTASLDWAALAWAQLWQVTLAALVVGLIARLACRRRPHLAYLLWMLVILKSLTPPLVASPTGLFSWALRETRIERTIATNPRPLQPAETDHFTEPRLPRPAKAEDRTADDQKMAAAAPVEPSPRVSPGAMLLGVWMAGFCAFSAWALVKWFAIRRIWSATAAPIPLAVGQQLTALAARLHVRRRVRLLVSSEAAVPAVFGIWRTTILLPKHLVERMTPAELEPILAHELIHVRRGDPAAALLQLLAQVLWWFHPLVWWANLEARRERERACDEEVIAGLGCRASDYARTLLTVLESDPRRHRPAILAPAVGMLNITARRLEHLVRGAGRFHRRTPWTYYLVAVVALLLMLPGAGLKAVADPPPADKDKRDNWVKLEFRREIWKVPQGRPATAKKLTETEQKAIERLRELGAQISEGFSNGERQISITFDRIWQGYSWKGTSDDFKILEQLADIGQLVVQVQSDAVDPAGLGQIKLTRPLHALIFANPSGATLEKLSSLPPCLTLILADATFTSDDCRRLAKLAGGVETLQINTPRPAKNADSTDAKLEKPGIDDEGLAYLTQLQSLKSLSLFTATISDKGLEKLAGLKRLESLSLGNCPDVHGRALVDFARLERLQTLHLIEVPIKPEGLKAITGLAHLTSLALQTTNFQPDDIGQLARLKKLRSLSLFGHWPAKEGLQDVALGDAVIELAGQLPDLETLAVGGIGISAKGFDQISKAQRLQDLYLSRVRISDQGLDSISGLTDLRKLGLEGEGSISDAGLAKLKPLIKLVRLTLPCADVTDEGLKHLDDFKAVKGLRLTRSKITGTGLSALHPLKKLTTLSLPESAFNDAGCGQLHVLSKLRNLDLSSSAIRDRGMADIGRLGGLNLLNISNTAVTDAGLAHLENLKRLRTVCVQGTKASAGGIKKLRAEVPGLTLWEGSVDFGFLSTDEDTYEASKESDETSNSPGAGLEAVDDPTPVDEDKRDAPEKPETTMSTPKGRPATAKKLSDAEQKAIERLRDLGARVDERFLNRQRQLSVSFDHSWKGTSDDFKTIEQLANVGQLVVFVRSDLVDSAGLAQVKLARPLNLLVFIYPSGATLDKLSSLPPCLKLILTNATFTSDDCRRLAKLADGVEMLQIDTPRPAKNADPAAAKLQKPGIDDEGLAYLVQLQSLKSLNLFTAAISDKGLQKLAGLKRLESLMLGNCPDVHGQGFVDLARLETLQTLQLSNVPIKPEGLKAITGLTHLTSLRLHPANFRPADVVRLARLKKLQSLALYNVWSGKEGFQDVALGDAVIELAGTLPDLKELFVNGIGVSAKGFDQISKAQRLQDLSVSQLHVSDQSLDRISGLTDLRKLRLGGEGAVSDAGLEKLKSLTKLAGLSLPGADVTDQGLKHLADFKALKELHLLQSKITGSGHSALKPLKQLTMLSLPRSAFNDAGCGQLHLLSKLRNLDLSSSAITDRGMAEIGKLASLQFLSINNTAVTEAGLAHLKSLKQLHTIHIMGTKTTEEGIAKLRAEMRGVNFWTGSRVFGYLSTESEDTYEPSEFEEETPE